MLQTKLTRLIPAIIRFRYMITFLLFSMIFAFVIQSITRYAAISADQDRVNEGLATVKQTKIDKKAVEQIKALRDNQVDVQPVLPKNRTNPF